MNPNCVGNSARCQQAAESHNISLRAHHSGAVPVPGGKPSGVLCGESSAPLRRGGNPPLNHSADTPVTVRDEIIDDSWRRRASNLTADVFCRFVVGWREFGSECR